MQITIQQGQCIVGVLVPSLLLLLLLLCILASEQHRRIVRIFYLFFRRLLNCSHVPIFEVSQALSGLQLLGIAVRRCRRNRALGWQLQLVRIVKPTDVLCAVMTNRLCVIICTLLWHRIFGTNPSSGCCLRLRVKLKRVGKRATQVEMGIRSGKQLFAALLKLVGRTQRDFRNLRV